MFLAKIVFSVFACTSVTKYVLVASEGDDKTERPVENHKFVALLDIAFVDGTKRVCTGTIIHDNAIITAAHCFLKHGSDYSDVELSGSYIVVGTKKMFNTGYETYLPIERVITHPNYRGWTADLALVFTFAGLTTDKPGHIIPIVEENESTPVDSNVTILSWGNYCDEEIQSSTTPSSKKRHCTSEEGDSCESRKHKTLREKSLSKEHADSGEAHKGPKLEQTDAKHRSFQVKVNSESTTIVLPSITTSNSGEVSTTMNVQTLSQDKDHDREGKVRDRGEDKDRDEDRDRDRDKTKESKETKASNEHIKPWRSYTKNGPTQSKEMHGTTEVKKPVLSIGSPYLIPAKKTKKKVAIVTTTTKKRRFERTNRSTSIVKNKEKDTTEKEPDWAKVLETVIQRAGLNMSTNEEKAKQLIKSRRSNKRHKHPPPEENKLTVETFGFVNVQTCKKLIDKALPKLYKINPNEVVCYAAEDHFISDDDSGAPAIREGRLVAVTVGGAECEGDHVAIGMKMTCFCSWILENLPPGENTWKCCTDCCGEENKDRNNKDRVKENEKKDATYLRSIRKKKSRKRSEEDK